MTGLLGCGLVAALVLSVAAAGAPAGGYEVTELVSLDNSNNQFATPAADASISDDGRFVAFSLPIGGSSWIRDRVLETTQPVAGPLTTNCGTFASSTRGAAISGDGRWVAFQSVQATIPNVVVPVVRRLSTGEVACPPVAARPPWLLSADGRFLTFNSAASDLVPGDTNGKTDVFVWDRITGATERVSGDAFANLAPNPGFEATNTYSANGACAFSASSDQSHSPTHSLKIGSTVSALCRWLSPISEIPVVAGKSYHVCGYLKTLNVANYARLSFNFWTSSGVYVPATVDAAPALAGTTDWTLVCADATAPAGAALLRLEGRLSGPGTSWFDDVAVADGATAESNGDSFAPDLSADGRYVAFESTATNLVPSDTDEANDVFVRDRATGTTQQIGRGTNPRISDDGRIVAFQTFVQTSPSGFGFTVVSAYDRQTGTRQLVSRPVPGGLIDFTYSLASLSGDGRYVAFFVHNLGVSGPAFDSLRVFDRQLEVEVPISVSASPPNFIDLPRLNRDGSVLVFSTRTAHLPTDVNGIEDVYAATRTQQNLVGNSDLELNPSTVSPFWATNGPGTFSWATDQSRSPSHSLKIASSVSTLSRWLSLIGEIAVVAGKSYHLCGYLKTLNVANYARLSFNFWTSSGVYVPATVDAAPALAGTTDWTLVCGDATAPAGAAYLRLEDRLSGPGTSWFDDIAVS